MATDSSYEAINLDSFKFQSGELISALNLINLHSAEFSGDFQVTFDRTLDSSVTEPAIWHLYFSKGKIVFSSSKDIAPTRVLKAISNYLPKFRDNQHDVASSILRIAASSQGEKKLSLLRLLIEVTAKTELLDYKEAAKAIQEHILNELDYYLILGSGNISLIEDKSVDDQRPIVGFDLEQIASIVKRRQAQWRYIKTFIPSMSCSFQCEEQSAQWQKIPHNKRIRIQQLLNSGNSLTEIRYKQGGDNLKLAKALAKLIRQGLITVESNTEHN